MLTLLVSPLFPERFCTGCSPTLGREGKALEVLAMWRDRAEERRSHLEGGNTLVWGRIHSRIPPSLPEPGFLPHGHRCVQDTLTARLQGSLRLLRAGVGAAMEETTFFSCPRLSCCQPHLG